MIIPSRKLIKSKQIFGYQTKYLLFTIINLRQNIKSAIIKKDCDIWKRTKTTQLPVGCFVFYKYKACQDEMTQITGCQAFIKGFKLGARFVMACFENDDTYTEWKSILIADITAFKPRNRAKDMQAGYFLPACVFFCL